VSAAANPEAQDEIPRPAITAICKRCATTWGDVESGQIIVSAAGVAHRGQDDGWSWCGRDARLWWWPL